MRNALVAFSLVVVSLLIGAMYASITSGGQMTFVLSSALVPCAMLSSKLAIRLNAGSDIKYLIGYLALPLLACGLSYLLHLAGYDYLAGILFEYRYATLLLLPALAVVVVEWETLCQMFEEDPAETARQI